jgi:hypothetical protein
MYFGGVWAYDLTQLTQPTGSWSNTRWINVVPDNNAGNNVPPAMNGQSVLAYEGMLVLVRVVVACDVRFVCFTRWWGGLSMVASHTTHPCLG